MGKLSTGGWFVAKPFVLFTFMQDDIVMGTLTVRENLHFSAALRLPFHMTWEQRKKRVEKVIEELGLDDCANTKVYNTRSP